MARAIGGVVEHQRRKEGVKMRVRKREKGESYALASQDWIEEGKEEELVE